MTTPPTPEAVEAAMKWAKDIALSPTELDALMQDAFGNGYDDANIILAAEVERLRADLERAEQKNEADRIARDHIISKGVALEKELAALKTDIRMAQEGTK
jgi:hypothetical protein